MVFKEEDFELFKKGGENKIDKIEVDALPYWVYPTAIKINSKRVFTVVGTLNEFGKIRKNEDTYEIIVKTTDMRDSDVTEMIMHMMTGLMDPYCGIQLMYGECCNPYMVIGKRTIVMKAWISYDTSEGPGFDYFYFGFEPRKVSNLGTNVTISCNLTLPQAGGRV